MKGTSQKVKRANILLKSDPGWTDEKIAEAFNEDARIKLTSVYPRMKLS